MINSKITKSAVNQLTTEDRVLKFLEGIDWKLWEIYKMLKEQIENAEETTTTKSTTTKK